MSCFRGSNREKYVLECPFAEQHRFHRSAKDVEIKPHRPVADIELVQLNTSVYKSLDFDQRLARIR